jgi:hypothetical protein
MIASEVGEALADVKWFMAQFERMYQTHIQTPHVQAEVSLIELVRAAKLGKHNEIQKVSRTSSIAITYGDFNLILIAEVD